jgi:hypothetical protein
MRCGKAVMLEIIRKELLAQGVPEDRSLFLNCESAAGIRLKSEETILETADSRFSVSIRSMTKACGSMSRPQNTWWPWTK